MAVLKLEEFSFSFTYLFYILFKLEDYINRTNEKVNILETIIQIVLETYVDLYD